MKKTIFRFISVILCVIMCVSIVSGTDVIEQRESRLEFINNARMASDGSFEFDIQIYKKSDTFTANSNSITIRANAKVQNIVNGTTSPSNDEKFDYLIILYENTLFGKEIGSFRGCSDGTTYKETFNVVSGRKYYFTIEPVSDIKGSAYFIVGTGSVSNITVN